MRLEKGIEPRALEVRAADERHGVAGPQLEFRLPGHSRAQFLDRDVLVTHDGRRAAVDLQGDDAGGVDAGFGLRVVDGLDPVEPDPDARPFGANSGLVPLTERFLRFGQHFGRGRRQHLLPAAFIIQRAVVAHRDVGLVAGHLVAAGDSL